MQEQNPSTHKERTRLGVFLVCLLLVIAVFLPRAFQQRTPEPDDTATWEESDSQAAPEETE